MRRFVHALAFLSLCGALGIAAAMWLTAGDTDPLAPRKGKR